MSTYPYPHRWPIVGGMRCKCDCGACPDYGLFAPTDDPGVGGEGCAAALREALGRAERQRDTLRAHLDGIHAMLQSVPDTTGPDPVSGLRRLVEHLREVEGERDEAISDRDREVRRQNDARGTLDKILNCPDCHGHGEIDTRHIVAGPHGEPEECGGVWRCDACEGTGIGDVATLVKERDTLRAQLAETTATLLNERGETMLGDAVTEGWDWNGSGWDTIIDGVHVETTGITLLSEGGTMRTRFELLRDGYISKARFGTHRDAMRAANAARKG